MMEPNPYQSSGTPNPLIPSPNVNRLWRARNILLLTPLAVIITGLVSAAISFLYFDANFVLLSRDNDPLLGVKALAILFVPPTLVLVGMLSCAVLTCQEQTAKASKNRPR